MNKTAYLSLGSNLGDRAANIERAIHMLEAAGVSVHRRSSLYETEPQDMPNQPWFLNVVLEIQTDLFPRQLLARIKRIESELGRKRVAARGPRTIDIDIILFGRFEVNTPELVIPHPRMAERRFVLAPLAELAPELRHPVSRESVRHLLDKVIGQVIRKVNAS